jgi:hypothetical protein
MRDAESLHGRGRLLASRRCVARVSARHRRRRDREGGGGKLGITSSRATRQRPGGENCTRRARLESRANRNAQMTAAVGAGFSEPQSDARAAGDRR